MSRYIATRAIRGAQGIVGEAEVAVNAALAELGPDTPVAFTNTAYYLPVIYAFTGQKVETLGDLATVIQRAKGLLHPIPGDKMWLPYLGETLDSGVATLFAEEAMEAVRFARGTEPQVIKLDHARADGSRFTGGDLGVHGDKMKLNGPIDDIQLRAWGIQLVDGRMPGFCAIVGCAKSNEVAVKIVRELQSRGILIFLSGNVNGRSIIHQLQEEGIQLGYDTFTVPFGIDTVSAVYALGFAARSALTFGGMEAGNARKIMLYNKYRVFAFVLALGEVDDLKYATAAGAISFGFPTIADTRIPQILPTGVTTYEHVVSMPFDEIPGADDMERTEKLIQRCIEVRGVKVKIAKVPIPVTYGSAFEGERIRKDIMYAEFGGKRSNAFEFLRMKPADEVEDGKINVIGTDIDGMEEGGALPLGMVVDVAGRKMQTDFEPILERQFHYFINDVEGIQHIGQRDIAWMRISKSDLRQGLPPGALRQGHPRAAPRGVRQHRRQGAGAPDDRPGRGRRAHRGRARGLRRARRAHRQADRRERRHVLHLHALPVLRAQPRLRDQPGAPGSVRRLQLARLQGALRDQPDRAEPARRQGSRHRPGDGRVAAASTSSSTSNSNQSVERVTLYSLMDTPMTSCGCFESIMVLVPEANGFMIVNREDPSMTPCGMTFSTLAGTVGGGMQTPGLMGMGKCYLTSKKFISARRRHEAHRLAELQPAREHAARAAGGLRAGGRARPARQDRRRDRGHLGRGAPSLPRGEGAPGPDHGPAVLMRTLEIESVLLTPGGCR